MAGLFGHEAEHREMSRDIFRLSWAKRIAEGKGALLATGFSCRSQAKRFAHIALQHPVQALDRALDA